MPRSPSWIEPDAFDDLISDAPARPSAPRASDEPPQPNLQDRVSALGRWLQQLLTDRAFFIADADGLALLRHQVEAKHVLSAVLMQANGVMREPLGGGELREVSVELDGGQRLTVGWFSTSMGRVAIGVFGPPPPEDWLELCEDACRQVFE